MYQAELKELGLTENESKVYLALLEKGILNPTALSKHTGMHRSYIYDTLERLLERGIVNTVLVKEKKHYQAVDPKALRELFELKLRHLDSIMPQLQGLYKETKQETRVELHRGKRVYRTLIKDIIANIQQDQIVYLIGADEALLESVEPIYLKQYLNIIKEKNIQEKIIIEDGAKILKEPHLEYKELDPKYFDKTTTVIFCNKVYIFIWGNPYNLVVIENEKVANTYRKQFGLLWEIAKP